MQVGNWSRWLTDLFGMDADDSVKEDQNGNVIDEKQDGEAELKCFNLLNALSDLLMLPKDLLMDRSIRAEVHSLVKLYSYHIIYCCRTSYTILFFFFLIYVLLCRCVHQLVFRCLSEYSATLLQMSSVQTLFQALF